MTGTDPWRKVSLLSLMLGILMGGCSTMGPPSIDQGRTPYDEVIHNTSEKQTLLDLVRVSAPETPPFVNVTEVDAVTMA